MSSNKNIWFFRPQSVYQRRYHGHLERLGDETDVVPGSVADPQKWLQFAGIVGVRMLQLSLIHAYGIIFTSSILHS